MTANDTSAPNSSPANVPVETHVPLGTEARAEVANLWRLTHGAYQKVQQELTAGKPVVSAPVPPPSQADLDALIQFVEEGVGDVSKLVALIEGPQGEMVFYGVKGAMGEFAARPDVQLIHVLRLAKINSHLKPQWWRRVRTWQLLAGHLEAHKAGLTLSYVAAVLEKMEVSPSEVGEIMLTAGSSGSSLMQLDASGVWPYFAERPQILLNALDRPDPMLRQHVYSILRLFPATPKPFDEICWGLLLTCPKDERPLVQAALEKAPDRRERIHALLAAKKADTRAMAAEWLGRVGTQEDVPGLKAALQKEKQDASARVMAAALEKLGVPLEEMLAEEAPRDGSEAGGVKGMISSLTAGAQAPVEAVPELPPLPPVELHVPLSAEGRAALDEVWKATWQAALGNHAKFSSGSPKPDPMSEEDMAQAARLVEGVEQQGKRGEGVPAWICDNQFLPRLHALKFAAHPGIKLIHALRLARMLFTSDGDRWVVWQLQRYAWKYYLSHTPRFTLRELAATLEAIGLAEEHLIDVLLTHRDTPLMKLEPDGIWPYFALDPEPLEKAWNSQYYAYGTPDLLHARVAQIISLLPQLPRRFELMFWDSAFNGSKKDRPLAQAALEKAAGKEARIIEVLSSKKPEHRGIAAAWLGRLGCTQAVPALKKALTAEKNESAAGDMMVALEKLGVPLEEFISLDGLLKEAEAALQKGIPKELAWFKMDQLPAVRWQKHGEAVRPEIIQWMVLQSHGMVNPEPGPRLRQYVSYFHQGDAEALGQYVLEAWIAHDTATHSPEQAHQFAEAEAKQYAAMAQQRPQFYIKSYDQVYRESYDKKIAEPLGSAHKDRGLLAIAAACCGARAAAPAQRYLKTYHGLRLHQSKALIQMLAWIESPSAIQVLLPVANRFRTAALRQEAEKHVGIMAERKGWTVDELADRTIPTAGFDENLSLILDFGPRQFTAKLDGELNIILLGEDGKPIKALPAPRQDDDAELAKAAKAELATAKKELATVLKMQSERLYEAMCIQRNWRYADWDQFLNRHPIVRSYCRRLVWATLDNGKLGQTFRPLEDGTLTDAQDKPVQVEPEASIVLAHACTAPAEVAEAWRKHYLDYQVVPLFEQFGKAVYALPAEKREDTAIEEFKGYLLESFKLRGRLTKLNYTRGAAEDGGWFTTYHKLFSGLGLTATIQFTGGPLPEQNRTVALESLYFQRAGENGSMTHDQVPLGEIPPVLLSEAWGDLRAAAAEGPGYDAEWEKKAAY